MVPFRPSGSPGVETGMSAGIYAGQDIDIQSKHDVRSDGYKLTSKLHAYSSTTNNQHCLGCNHIVMAFLHSWAIVAVAGHDMPNRHPQVQASRTLDACLLLNASACAIVPLLCRMVSRLQMTPCAGH